MDKDLKKLASEIAVEQEELHKSYEAHVDAWWDKLSETERQQAFYAVCKRIHKAEVERNSTYRGTLYNVFGFGPEMYGQGMDCGFFALHNQLFDGDQYEKMQSAKAIKLVDQTGIVSDIEVAGVQDVDFSYNDHSDELTIYYNFSGTGTTRTQSK